MSRNFEDLTNLVSTHDRSDKISTGFLVILEKRQ